MTDNTRFNDAQRLVDLESRVAFQDDTLNKLDAVITEQQRLIERMQLDIDMLRERLIAISASLVVDEAHETPPPHY
jgi:SlyX protein